MRTLPFVAAALRIGVAAVFLAAVVGKLTEFKMGPRGPATGLRAFALLIEQNGILPEALAYPVAAAVVLMESLLALWLLLHIRPKLAAGSAMVLVLAFSAYLIAVYAIRGPSACGCFGGLTSGDLDSSLLRNFALVAACAVSYVPGAFHRSVNSPLAHDQLD